MTRCLLVASAFASCLHAYRHETGVLGELSVGGAGRNATFPGGGCSVEQCCEANLYPLWDYFYNIAQGSSKSFGFNYNGYDSQQPLRCALLAVATNPEAANGICQENSEGKVIHGGKDVATILKENTNYANVQLRPLVASILAEGSCLQSAQQEMSEGTCYVAPEKSNLQIQWNTVMYHGSKDAQLNRIDCNGGTTSYSDSEEPLSWGRVCHAEEVEGRQVYSMQVRAMYINTSAIRSQNVCSAKADLLFEKSLTIKDWNPAASPGQPRWTCLDIDDKYHLLMHSFGPPPCEPLPEASTSAPSTTESEATAASTIKSQETAAPSTVESPATAAPSTVESEEVTAAPSTVEAEEVTAAPSISESTSPALVATTSTAVPQTTVQGGAKGSQGLHLLWLVTVISLQLV